ncbi:nucleotidyltransferase domain-containing protein [Natronobeatus ordinarius]|uniref:nucleotidyltransferase domain-containing protein n=1 Tax=Natronobeatus ordinarius TaxID=2963433 RepID=UPI0020CBB52E|nr:nucleotidyltransferase domain-containing protein [Natronobeatus ordinarius]
MASPSVDAALESIETAHDVRIVAARDVGSRAWNLADADSDRDVAVVYAQRPLEYASLGGYEPSLEWTDGALDCRGWNVRRFAELVVDSNPTVFEFLHSPRRYREFGPLARLEADVGDSFAPLALYHHYRSLARRQYRKYLQGRLLEDGELAYLVLEERDDECLARPVDGDRDDAERVPVGAYEEGQTDRTVKRHLYVARGVCYAQYVRETHRFPTLDFPRFLEAEGDRFEPSFVDRTLDLVERKRRGKGDAVVGRLFDPAEVHLSELEPADHAGRRVDRARVDAFLRETLEAAFD